MKWLQFGAFKTQLNKIIFSPTFSRKNGYTNIFILNAVKLFGASLSRINANQLFGASRERFLVPKTVLKRFSALFMVNKTCLQLFKGYICYKCIDQASVTNQGLVQKAFSCPKTVLQLLSALFMVNKTCFKRFLWYIYMLYIQLKLV